MNKIIVSFATLLIFISGCAVRLPPTYEKNGQAFGWTKGMGENFRDTWYDYYECGLSYLEGDYFEQTIWAMDASIRRLSENRQKDRRMARTYGMHFIDYFPHREKGIALYYLSRYEAAKNQLEMSVSQYPSEKAYIYLDKVRQKLFEKSETPAAVPELHVSVDGKRDAKGRILTNAAPITVAIRAKDERFVSRITLRNRPLFLEKSEQAVKVRERLFLDEGQHRIVVSAQNLMRRTASESVEIIADRTAPMIALTDYEPGITAQGVLVDRWPGVRLLANGEQIAVSNSEETAFSLPPKLADAGVVLEAEDMAGNRTELRIGEPSLAGRRSPLLAGNGVPVMFSAWDSQAPVIRITNGLQDGDTVFRETVGIGVRISGKRAIETIRINKTRIPAPKGAVVSFVHQMHLSRGANPVEISATDSDGKRETVHLMIHRSIPEAFQLKHRFGMMLSAFESATGTAFGSSIYALIVRDMAERKRFRIGLENDLQDAELLRETSLIDEPASDGLLLGNAYRTVRGLEIAVRLVDTQSRILAFADAYEEAADGVSLKTLAYRLCEKLHRRAPLMHGRIESVNAGNLELVPEHWEPEAARLIRGWPMLIYTQSDKSNMMTGVDAAILGNARITKTPSLHRLTATPEGCRIKNPANCRAITR
jgi:hypothetical protein